MLNHAHHSWKYGIGIAVFLCAVFFPTPSCAQINVSTVVTVPNVTLAWEANSYVPPLYRGKALMPDGGDMRIVAFLPSTIPNAAGATYTWRINGTVDAAASGQGKHVYELRSPLFGGQSLIVVEVSVDGEVVGTGAVRTPLAEPQALLYADSPLAGVLFNTENPHLSGKEVSIETYPLFFTAPQRNDPALSYEWEIDGVFVENPNGNSGRLTLVSEKVGTTTVAVSITHADRLLEYATGILTLLLQ